MGPGGGLLMNKVVVPVLMTPLAGLAVTDNMILAVC